MKYSLQVFGPYYTLLVLGCMSVVLPSCGSLNKLKVFDSPKKSNQSSVQSSSNATEVVAPHTITNEADLRKVEKEVGSLNSEVRTLEDSGPSLRNLPPKALKAMYRRVFGENPKKIEPFNGQFFSEVEEKLLGNYVITKVENSQPIFSMSLKSKPDSDYFSGLRGFLGTACTKLVQAEMVNESLPTHFLVSETDKDLKIKINKFISTLLGYEGISGQHFGQNQYFAAFETSLKSTPVPATPELKLVRRRESYIHLCIALAMDPRVFTR
jgi:hypothetical protein